MATPISAGKQIGGKLNVPTGTPVSAGKEMSGSLKERLKRSSRYYKSPLAPKRLCHSPVSSYLSHKPAEDEIANTCVALNSRITFPCHVSPYRPDTRDSPPRTPDTCQTDVKTNTAVAHQRSATEKINNRTLSASSAVASLNNTTSSAVASLNNTTSSAVASLNNTTSSRLASLTKSSESHITECQNNCEDTALNLNSSLNRSESVTAVDSDTALPCKLDPVSLVEGDVPGAGHSSRTGDDQLTQMSGDIINLKRKKNELLSAIVNQEERLRKLKMVKMYRTKNDLQELERLSVKWRGVSQEALQDLWQLTPEPKPSMTDLVKHFQLDHQLIGFNQEDDSFLS